MEKTDLNSRSDVDKIFRQKVKENARQKGSSNLRQNVRVYIPSKD